MNKEVEGIVDRTYDKAYNQGISHAIVVIKDYYGGTKYHIPKEIDEIISRIEKLKSKQ